MVDQFDYYILPVFNVDGYAYTWTHGKFNESEFLKKKIVLSLERLWRKTRSPTSNPRCFGADPNRNWDYHWCEGKYLSIYIL